MKIENKSKFKISLPLESGKAEPTVILPFQTVFIEKPVSSVKQILANYIGQYVEVDYDADADVIKVTDIKVSDIQVEVGKFHTLEAEVIPNTAEQSGVTFELVTGEDVISLKDGIVEALAKGSAEIKAVSTENPEITKNFKVHVFQTALIPTEIKTEKSEYELEVGQTFEVPVQVLPEESEDKRYKLVSAHGGIVGVQKTKIVAKTAGETTIKVIPNANSQLTYEFKVKVIDKA